MVKFGSLFKHLDNFKGVAKNSGAVGEYASKLNSKLGKNPMSFDSLKKKWQLLGKDLPKLPKDLDEIFSNLRKKGTNMTDVEFKANVDLADTMESGMKKNADTFDPNAKQVELAAEKLPETKIKAKKFANDVDGKSITSATPDAKISKKVQTVVKKVAGRLGIAGATVGAIIVGLKLYAEAKKGCYLVNSSGTAANLEDDIKTKVADSPDPKECTCLFLKGASIDAKCGDASGCTSGAICKDIPAVVGGAAAISQCYCGDTAKTVTLLVDDVGWTDVLSDMVGACGELITDAFDLAKATLSAGKWIATHWYVFVIIGIVLVGIILGIKYGLAGAAAKKKRMGVGGLSTSPALKFPTTISQVQPTQ